MKLINVETNDSGDTAETLIEESDSIEHLKTVGLARVNHSDEKKPEWLDRSPPVMGNKKLKDRKIRLTLRVSDNQFFVLQS